MNYDTDFYRLEESTALRSAKIILPHVLHAIKAKSVVDVGCGTGAWLSIADKYVLKIHGYDSYDGSLLIPNGCYSKTDIADGIDCTGYDLAICLEVGEHLPETSAAPLVEGLCGARYVLFSAAIPGQPGVNHVNCQWGTWWADHFRRHGYEGSSDIRWAYWHNRTVADWYRQNILIFATPDDLTAAHYRPGVIDVVHPERMGNW